MNANEILKIFIGGALGFLALCAAMALLFVYEYVREAFANQNQEAKANIRFATLFMSFISMGAIVGWLL